MKNHSSMMAIMAMMLASGINMPMIDPKYRYPDVGSDKEYICKNCNKPFTPRSHNKTTFCTTECFKEYDQTQKRLKNAIKLAFIDRNQDPEKVHFGLFTELTDKSQVKVGDKIVSSILIYNEIMVLHRINSITDTHVQVSQSDSYIGGAYVAIDLCAKLEKVLDK